MEVVRLGRTNIFVKKLGWGGIPIQRASEEEAIKVIKEVVNMGVDLLDTARAYTNSEERIGRALKGVKKSVFLSSKSHVRDAKIYDEVLLSLKNLQVKKINIYHLHNVSSFSDYEKVMGPGGAYQGLKKAQNDGLIEHLGITSHSLAVLERAIKDDKFSVIMACYSFLEPAAAEKIFPLAKEKDLGILAMKPFSGGVIENVGVALRYVLGTPNIVAIPGSETLAKARENWEIYQSGAPLNDEDQAYIKKLRQEFDRQFCRRCDYCQPCTQQINIQLMLGIKSAVKRFGHPEEVKWIKDVVEKARNCTECGECLPRCPYQLPIPELIKKNLAWLDSLPT